MGGLGEWANEHVRKHFPGYERGAGGGSLRCCRLSVALLRAPRVDQVVAHLGNQRRFDRSVLRRVAVIRAAQRAGIPLQAIAGLFAGLPDDGAPTQGDWQALSLAWRDDLQERIHQLQSLRDGLGGCIGCGCLSLTECGFVNPEDRLADADGGALMFREKKPDLT